MEKRTTESSGNIELDIARLRVAELKSFYSHLLIYVIGVLLFVSKTFFGLAINFWPIKFINEFFMWVWTFIIAVQGIKLFFKVQLFGAKWEQRKIDEMMNKENKSNQKWN